MNTPMSRSMMKGLKAKKDEEDRCDRIKEIVDTIYTHAISIASVTTNTSFNFLIPCRLNSSQTEYKTDTFYLENMSDILKELRKLFTDCDVSHAIMAHGKSGKLYDVKKLNRSTLTHVDRVLDCSYIVIDWS
jgi:hypothetical protein